jgi:hypothetical protein
MANVILRFPEKEANSFTVVCPTLGEANSGCMAPLSNQLGS